MPRSSIDSRVRAAARPLDARMSRMCRRCARLAARALDAAFRLLERAIPRRGVRR